VTPDFTPSSPRRHDPHTLAQIEGLEALRAVSSDGRWPRARLADPNPTRDDAYLGSFPERQSQPSVAPAPASSRERGAGRHHSSQSRRDELLRQHGARFASFSAIGGGIFVAGLALQAALTSGLHVPSFISYLIQSLVSVEASYLLNRWVTWRGARTPFWGSFFRYNLQKAVTVAANLILYAGLLKLGTNYLLANVLLTIVFTFVNYIGADRFVFLRGSKQLVAAVTGPIPILTGPMPVLRVDQQARVRRRPITRELPTISVVIPVRSNESTIRAAIESILGQDYPTLREVILVGSPDDSTWLALDDIRDPRLFIRETETPPGIRDANFKRDLGIHLTTGALIALIDSDMVIPPDWMSSAVRLLMENEVDCVAGVMRSIRDDFWGRFVDRNRLSAKTPRADTSYLVTVEGFGAAGYKPPITADILFTRKMYERCPIDSSWSHGSLEDYEWFWRVVESGHQVLVSDQLFGWHHHRAGFKDLGAEYRRSARGCAYFIRAHRDSPFAQKRMTQAIVLPLGVLAALIGLAVATAMGEGLFAGVGVLGLALVGVVLLCGREFVRSRTFESLIYPVPALVLGVNYTVSLVANLIRNAPVHAATTDYGYSDIAADSPRQRTGLSRLLHPLTGILVLQAAGSLSLVWSNTAFSDEADYLWLGHLILSNWLHGTSWPAGYAQDVLSGSPVIYPPIGALADSIGGLAGARILSMLFMLGATCLLYSAAARLFDRNVAIFATAFWAISEPTMKLSFATYDPLSVSLTALAAWLAVQVPVRKLRGEFVLLTGITLALANATAYSGIVIDPVVIVFAFLVWRSGMGNRSAWSCTAWLAAVMLTVFTVALTVGRSWRGIMTTVVARGLVDQQALSLVVRDVWAYSGFVMVLALAGVVLAIGSRNKTKTSLVILLGLAALVVPAAQIHDHTAWSLDKHLAYGIWFASMAAGYAAASAFRGGISSFRRFSVVGAGIAALIYPGLAAWQSAWLNYHGWANATSFIAAIRPLVATMPGNFYMEGGVHIAEYYTPQGSEWGRWTDIGLPQLTASNVPLAVWDRQLRQSNYTVVALFYPTTFSAPSISGKLLLSRDGNAVGQALLSLAGQNASQPGLPNATVALETDPTYRITGIGPYDSLIGSGIYVIWAKEGK
jgi:putative flippase GtrA